MFQVAPAIRTLAELKDPLLEFTKDYLTLNRFRLPEEGPVARQWCHARALEGDAHAQLAYSQLLVNGIFGYKEKEEAISFMQQATAQGHAPAMAALSPYVEQGYEGCPKDISKAFSLIKRSAEQGYAPAWGLLGIWYQCGLHVEEDLKVAMQYHQKAAELGFVGSQYSLGCLLLSRDNKIDWERGVALIQAAADQGLALAHETLGSLFRSGRSGVVADAERSRHHYYVSRTLSAEAGSEFGVQQNTDP